MVAIGESAVWHFTGQIAISQLEVIARLMHKLHGSPRDLMSVCPAFVPFNSLWCGACYAEALHTIIEFRKPGLS